MPWEKPRFLKNNTYNTSRPIRRGSCGQVPLAPASKRKPAMLSAWMEVPSFPRGATKHSATQNTPSGKLLIPLKWEGILHQTGKLWAPFWGGVPYRNVVHPQCTYYILGGVFRSTTRNTHRNQWMDTKKKIGLEKVFPASQHGLKF